MSNRDHPSDDGAAAPRGRKPSAGTPRTSAPKARGTKAPAPSPLMLPTADADSTVPSVDEFRLFRALADNAFFGNVISDSDGNIRYANRYFAEIHGYAPEELIGRHFSLVHTPEQVATARKIMATAARNGSAEPQEHWFLHRDGTVFPLLVGVLAMEAENGADAYMAMSAVDLSPVRKAEAAYLTLFNKMLDGFAHHQIICDESGAPVDYRFLKVNPAFERITGLVAADVVGRTVLEALPETEQRWIDTYGKVALTGEPTRFQDYSGALDKYFEVMAFRPAPGEFACIFQDITESKRADEALRASQRELLSTQRLMGLGSWKRDSATDTAEWTETLYELFHLDPGSPVPTLAQQKALFTPASYEALMAAEACTFKTGVPYEMEFEIVRPYGASRWVWARGERVMDAAGRPTGLRGVVQDITAKKREVDERLSLETQLTRARKLEAVGTLAGGVAHDFNNMLTVILGHTERLLGDIEPDDPAYADLEEIRRAAERSADLTHQLLTFARNQPVTPKVIDLNEAVTAVLTMLRRLIGEDVELTWMPGARPSFVRIDPSQVDQILANLCVNARDAIDGTGEITVKIDEAAFDDDYCLEHPDYLPGEYVQLTVSDNGSGMDSETLGHLFEPFFTTKEYGRGTGLGLATVYGIVRQNEGFVNADSKPGVGTTFTIFLPRSAEVPTPMAGIAAIEPEHGGSETILVVEDEPAILTLAAKTLKSRGYTVLAAGTPSEAIDLAESHPAAIDLLVTDVTLPEMNGRALADVLRSSHPDLKCLYMSGYTANVMNGNKVLEEGASFIAKPFSLKDLAIKVRETLGG